MYIFLYIYIYITYKQYSYYIAIIYSNKLSFNILFNLTMNIKKQLSESSTKDEFLNFL